MATKLRLSKNLSIALLMFGLALGSLASLASAETLTLSQPTKDSSYFVPGETVTITYTGMGATTGYDLIVWAPNGSAAMNGATPVEQRNVTAASGTFTWALVIPTDFEGTYSVRGYLNATGANAGAARSFTVHLFGFSASVDHNVYLPSDTVTVFYYTQRYEDQKPLASGSGHWRMAVQRDNGTGTITDTLGGSFTAPQGTFAVDLPSTTRTGYYTLYVTYNDTTDKHSVTANLGVAVGTFNVGVSLDRSNYNSGDTVVVTVTATTSYYSSERTAGVAVTTKVELHDIANATWGTDSTYTVPAQTTGSNGMVSFTIPLHSGIADGTEMRVTVSAVKGGSTQEASAAFTIRAPTGLSIDLQLDKTDYKAGDTIVAHLKFISSNATLIAGSMYLWTFTDGYSGNVLLQDYAAGTATGADKSYVIPAGFTGSVHVQVTVYTPDDRTYSRSDSANIVSATLLINPAKMTYKPGETVHVDATLVSDQITGPTFLWSVTPYSGGEPITQGSSTPGGMTVGFSFTAPNDPDDRYTIKVTASGAGQVVTDSTNVDLEKYVTLQVQLPDKSFKPGDTVTIHYTFVMVGGATPPTSATITVYLYGGFGSTPGGASAGSQTFQVSALDGNITYTIPPTAPASGDLMLYVSSGSYGSTFTPIYLRPAGGAAPASAAASTATWGLVIAVLALFVAVLAMMRKPRTPSPSGGDSFSRSTSYSEMKSEAPKKEDAPAEKKADVKPDEQPKSL